MTTQAEPLPLAGKIALVAGATRGAGRAIAVELARAGAFVYATGRSSRVSGRSEMERPETIEETGELIGAAGGQGQALRVDHLERGQVADLVSRIDREHGRLDILVNDIFGGDRYTQFDKKLWEHDLDGGLRMLRMGIDTHLITSAVALPLMLRQDDGLIVEMTDGTSAVQQGLPQGRGLLLRPGQGGRRADHDRPDRRTGRPGLHGAGRHPGLAEVGSHAGRVRGHRAELAGRAEERAAFLHLGVPGVRGAGRSRPWRRTLASPATRGRC